MDIGDKIEDYTITEIMDGGMSDIYRVIKRDERYVLKCLAPDADEQRKKLFKREIRIQKSLSHINVLEIVDDNIDNDNGIVYFVMPVCGKSFSDLNTKDYNTIELLDYCIQACDGLIYAHNNGVRHRDIKPQNILLQNKDVKIADFGISRFVIRDTTTLTETRLSAGTQGYIPPEYKDGAFKEGTIQGDIYMFGKTLYYLFSDGKDVSNVRQENVGFEIYKIVDRCTKDSLDDRYSSMEAVKKDLLTYKQALLDLQNAPMTIEEIRKQYKPSDWNFSEEIYKIWMSLDHASSSWASILLQLKDNEIIQVLKQQTGQITNISSHFIECLCSPSDSIQFQDIDTFAKFAKLLVLQNQDISSNQNMIDFLLDLSIRYNRFPAMNIVVEVLNIVTKSSWDKYKIFIILNKERLKEITPHLQNRNQYNSYIKSVL